MGKNTIGQKLSLLLFQKGMRPMDLAREIEVPQPTLHRILAGKSKKPHKETLFKIANYFGVELTKLIEEESELNVSSAASNSTHEIPLFSLEDNKSLKDMVQSAQNTLIVTPDISKEAFAINLADESLLPVFNLGNTLIFDPLKIPSARSYVLVELARTQKYIIRQLLTDGENRFLKPLNPEIAKLGVKILEAQDSIMGTLVEARQSYV